MYKIVLLDKYVPIGKPNPKFVKSIYAYLDNANNL